MLDIYTLSIVLTTVDMIFGSVSAFTLGKFTSSRFKSGALTHVLAITAIIIADYYEPVLSGYNIAVQAFVSAYAFTEFISILETYKSIGGELPDTVSKYINTKDKDKKK